MPNELENKMELATTRSAHLATAETATAAAAQKATALVQSRYVIAQKFPRDMDVVREKLLKECARPSFAAVAKYNKPVGGGIVGPSIRFAEAAIRLMGNIVVETTTVYDDREKRIVEVSVTDLEANVPYASSITIDKTVERKRVQDGDNVIRERLNSSGVKLYVIEATEDQILNKQNALISKAVRTNGLRLLPGDILDECMGAVDFTARNQDAKDPDAAKAKIFDEFGKHGVTVAQLKKFLGHEGTTLTPKEMSDLRGTYSAIKDGETTWREVMETKYPEPGKRLGLADIVDGKGKETA